MARSAVFLLLIGFALGAWLGFNPHAHQQVVNEWGRTQSFFMNLRSQVAGSSIGLTTQIGTQTGTQTQAKSKPAAQPNSVIARQISSMLATLWNALQHLWVQIRADLNLRKL